MKLVRPPSGWSSPKYSMMSISAPPFFGAAGCCPPTACIQKAACWPRADCVLIRAAAKP